MFKQRKLRDGDLVRFTAQAVSHYRKMLPHKPMGYFLRAGTLVPHPKPSRLSSFECLARIRFEDGEELLCHTAELLLIKTKPNHPLTDIFGE